MSPTSDTAAVAFMKEKDVREKESRREREREREKRTRVKEKAGERVREVLDTVMSMY